MRIIDTHCHYNMDPLHLNWQDHWQKAQEKDVVGAVVVGTQIETTNRAFEIATNEPNLLVSVGVHPTHVAEITLDQLEKASEAWVNKIFDAVGETGLDYYRLDRESDKFESAINQQKQIFHWHIQLALKHEKPLILHVRDKGERAYRDALEIIKTEYTSNKPFVLHCASGPLDYVKEAVELGGYVGFDGNLTYPSADNIRQLVKSVPANRLLIETDSPFLAPQNHRGKLCEPWMIAETARYAESELGLKLDQIFENTQKFFNHSFAQ